MFLLYYEGPCIKRFTGGALWIENFSEFAVAVNISNYFLSVDLQELKKIGLILELDKSYNRAKMFIRAPHYK